jgi:hypothetical protein
MIGVYSMYVFGEGLKGREGHINIDFLKATTSGSPASPKLRGAIKLYRNTQPPLAENTTSTRQNRGSRGAVWN